MSDPENIKKIVHKVVGQLNSDQKNFESELLLKWKDFVGERIDKHTKPLKINHQTLFVLVDHPSWIYELKSKHTHQILSKIRQAFGKDKVRKIIFQIGVI